MRGYGGRVGFTTFARIFTGSFCVFCGFCCVVVVLFLGFSAFRPVKRLLHLIPVSPFLQSHISRVDRPCPVLARQCRKKNTSDKKEWSVSSCCSQELVSAVLSCLLVKGWWSAISNHVAGSRVGSQLSHHVAVSPGLALSYLIMLLVRGWQSAISYAATQFLLLDLVEETEEK